MSEQPVVDGILARRSVRTGFTDDPVPRSLIEQIVVCGLAAPSSKNAQPWRFHVVSDRERLQGIADSMTSSLDIEDYVPHDPETGAPRPDYDSTVRESAQVLASVPAAIFVENVGPFSGGRFNLMNADRDRRTAGSFGYSLELAGLGAAVQNMWLAAIALGLSAAFMGDIAIAEDHVREDLGLTVDLLGALAVGWAKGESSSQPRQARDPSDGRFVVWH